MIVWAVITIIACRFLPYAWLAVYLTTVIIAAGVKAYLAFTWYGWLIDVSWFMIAIFLVGFHATFTRFILEFNLKQQIRKQFERYLDPRQVAILQKDPSKLKLGAISALKLKIKYTSSCKKAVYRF